MLEGAPKFRADFWSAKFVRRRMCLYSEWNQETKRFWSVVACLHSVMHVMAELPRQADFAVRRDSLAARYGGRHP
jgi:hypothetical protein